VKYRAVTVGLERNDQFISNSLEVVRDWASITIQRYPNTVINIYQTSEKCIYTVVADGSGVHTKEH
jgi:hypothetical protein